MNALPAFNNRYMIVFMIFLLAFLLGALTATIFIFGNLWMGMGGMMLAPGASAGVNGGMMSHMMGINGQAANEMMASCANMMQNFQHP